MVHAVVEVLAEPLDAGEFRVGPLVEQLTHHPAFGSRHAAVRRVPAVPVGHCKQPSRAHHPQQLIGITLFVGHVGASLHTPDRIKALIGQLKIQGVHHLEAAAQA